jgi:hypothetical protein
MTEAAPIERVSLRLVRPDFGFVNLRLPGVFLQGIEARRNAQGRVTLKCPTQRDHHGRSWPLFTLQPGTVEAAAEEVAKVWRTAMEAGHGGVWTH